HDCVYLTPWLVNGLNLVITQSTEVDESMFGGNASAEGGGEDFAADVKRDVDIILAHSLKEILGLDRKSYMTLFKEYAAKLNEHYKEKLPDKVGLFQDQFQLLLKELKKLMKAEEFQFYQAESASGEGMVGLLGYKEDGLTPYMIFYKLGLREMKQ
ncbi:hypothetical protein, partial [Salmonella sp. s54395]|uniref:hypothetical protein n=1 Tax=Salmonella sp. s54395 TaxID=3159664 RepID=UPI00397F61D3